MCMGDYSDNLLPYGGYMVWVVGGGLDGAWFYHSNKIVWILQCILSMILSNPCNIHDELHFLRQYPRWSIFGNNVPAISTESSTLCNIHINFYKNEKCMRNHAISTAISTLAVGRNYLIL